STLTLGAGAALADETESQSGFDHPVAPVSRALEITIGGGYTQGTGDIGDNNPSIQDISKAGGTVELQLGYRIIPSLVFGAYGTYQQFSTGDLTASGFDVRGGTAGLYADWHFRPDRSVDPWVGLASGWRGLWLVPDGGKNTSLQGWEIARLQAGLDYKVTPEVALGPVVGASVTTFFTEDSPASSDFGNIHNPQANWLFFAGLQGHFDLFGH